MIRTFQYYYHPDKANRVFFGYIPSESNFHYGFVNGQLDSDGHLIITMSSSDKPKGLIPISPEVAAAILIQATDDDIETISRIILGIYDELGFFE